MARQSREDRGRRADAERNIAAIIDAGVRLLSRDPNASVADIAKAAGVGRVTLYGHFPSREALIDRVLAHAVAQAEHALALDVPAGRPASEAVVTLIESSWEILERHSRLFVAADRALPTERIREHHDLPLRRVEQLLQHGRDNGEFRTDLPLPWLVATFFGILHSAAQEVEAGRLDRGDAARVLTSTLVSVLVK